MRELQRPILNLDSELMPPPPPPSLAGQTSDSGRSNSPNRPFPFTAADRASAAVDLESLINILVEMVHFYPQWGES